MSYGEPTFRARLNDNVRARMTQRHEGKGYIQHQVGNTNIRLEKGLPYADIAWGIDGRDYPISSEVANFVDVYELTVDYSFVRRVAGIYVLRGGGRNKPVLARARVLDSGSDKSSILVSGKEREDVVKLYELVRDGKVNPEAELTEFKQIEGGLRELNRLRNRVPQLEQDVAIRDSRLKVQSEQLRSVREQLSKVQATAAGK